MGGGAKKPWVPPKNIQVERGFAKYCICPPLIISHGIAIIDKFVASFLFRSFIHKFISINKLDMETIFCHLLQVVHVGPCSNSLNNELHKD